VARGLNQSSGDTEEDSTALVELPPEVLAQARASRESSTTRLRADSAEAEVDEPTGLHSLILVTAVAHSDTGLRRKLNEDSFRVVNDHSLFVVADGMGGHLAGDVASRLAVEVISEAFEKSQFVGPLDAAIPRRGDELVRAVQMANQAVFSQARSDRALKGMGTTIVAARFTPRKQRAYIAHVGDSRCYRLRQGQLKQLTTDHTYGTLTGATGSLGAKLTRALGARSSVEIDLTVDAPLPHDHYILCSDGLTKMLTDEQIREALVSHPDLQIAAQCLVDLANEKGGADNTTVIVVRVDPVSSLSLS
jgi:protein phosphatase